jgi:muramidase (phage lysozyme)
MALYTPEEIRQLYDEYHRLRVLSLPITRDVERQLRDAAVGVKNYSQQLDSSLNQLKSSSIGLFGSFKDGQQGASVFNDSLRSGADLLSVFLKALGPLGWVLGGIVKAGAEYVVAANEQSDALFDSYTGLNKLGIGMSNGVDGVYRLGQQLGYSIKELPALAELLSKNSQELAALGGTSEKGAKRLGDTVDSMRVYEAEFRRLGISIQDQNEGTAGYLRMQSMTGRGQLQDLDSLSSGAREYIKQQQLIAKITGQNAQMQMSADEEMLANANFQVAQRELRKQQEAALAQGDQTTAARLNKQYNENIKLIRMLPKDQRKGAMDQMTGFAAATKEAEQFNQLAPQAARRIRSGQFEATATLDLASQEAGQNLNRFSNSLGKLGMIEDLLGSYAGMRDLELLTAKATVASREQAAGRELEDQTNIKGATAAYADMLVEHRRTREALTDFINAGINPVTSAMSGLASAAEKISGIGAKAVGAPAPAPAVPAPAPAPAPSAPAGSTKALLDLIGRVEARGNYNILVGGRTDPKLTEMTLAEVLSFQSGMIGRGHESTAVGRYQIIKKTLQGLINQGAAQLNEKFGPDTQDRLAIALLNGRGYQKFLQGKMPVDQFANRVAMEWASFPVASGQSYYKGVGSNKALVDRDTVISTLRGYEFGGIAQGPESGFEIMMHGPEAVIPMNANNSITVDLQGMSASMQDQFDIMSTQSSKLDDLISIMRKRNNISEKILRAYQN